MCHWKDDTNGFAWSHERPANLKLSLRRDLDFSDFERDSVNFFFCTAFNSIKEAPKLNTFSIHTHTHTAHTPIETAAAAAAVLWSFPFMNSNLCFVSFVHSWAQISVILTLNSRQMLAMFITVLPFFLPLFELALCVRKVCFVWMLILCEEKRETCNLLLLHISEFCVME